MNKIKLLNKCELIMKKKDIVLCKYINHTILTNPSISHYFDFSYKTQKYKLYDMLCFIIIVLRYNYIWAHSVLFDICKSTVYSVFRRLVKCNVFEDSYKALLLKYIPTLCNRKKRIHLTDSTSILNKRGKKNKKNNITNCATNINNIEPTRNTRYNNKKSIKLSFISLFNGIPYNISFDTGKTNDSKILCNQLKTENLIDLKYLKSDTIYFLADKGYDSKENRNIIESKKMIPIIDHNNRNTKDKNKIKKLTKNEKKIYKKRIRIENIFSNLKNNYKRLDKLYDSNVKIYKNFVYLALSVIVKNLI